MKGLKPAAVVREYDAEEPGWQFIDEAGGHGTTKELAGSLRIAQVP